MPPREYCGRGSEMSLSHKLAVLFALALALPAIADDNPYRLKPGATGTICLDCHVAIEETMELPHVHSPVKAGACSDCHNPHASEHGRLLMAEAGAICASCHADIIPEDARSVHAVILEEGCASCHDPHASKYKKGLTAPGNQLCLGCHTELAAKLNNTKFQHAPVADDCMTCHNPHASTAADFLLTAAPSAICGECHDTEDATFVGRHMGYDVSESRCSSCHDPHGGQTSGMFLANVHAPLTRKMCNQCHMDPASRTALSTKKTGIEMCRSCHSKEINKILANDRIHWPVADQTACLNCHNPHASSEDALLAEPMTALCGSCHETTAKQIETSLVRHAPVEEGDCSVCHSPHASDNPSLMPAASVEEVCAACHDWKTHSTHPIGIDFADQRNVNLTIGCLSCHEAHASQHKAFSLKNPGGDLCVECHQLIQR